MSSIELGPHWRKASALTICTTYGSTIAFLTVNDNKGDCDDDNDDDDDDDVDDHYNNKYFIYTGRFISVEEH